MCCVAVVARQQEVNDRGAEVQSLRKELASRPNVLEVTSLKQQIAALQALYFNAQEEPDPADVVAHREGGPSATPRT